MLIRLLAICILCRAVPCTAQDSSQNAPLSAAKAWWHATTFGDTAYLKDHSTGALTVIFNNGRSFTRSQIMAQVATHSPSANIRVEWSESMVQLPAPQTAIVTGRVVETVGRMPHHYLFLTVLVKEDAAWMVAAAQSTRVLELTPPIGLPDRDILEAYAGSYRTPAGGLLKLVLRDSALVLVEPSGTETELAPIGPDLFEVPRILSAGHVRFAFSRDRAGGISNMTRIAHRITVMPRVR